MKKFFALVLIVAMMLSIVACGSDEKKGDPNLIKIGKYEALYTKHEIVKDYDGDDAIAIYFTYTNKSDEAQMFDWAFTYHAYQNDTELEFAVVFVSEDSFDTLTEDLRTEVAAGESLDVIVTYKLKDTTSAVELKFSDLFGEKNDSLTIDLSK